MKQPSNSQPANGHNKIDEAVQLFDEGKENKGNLSEFVNAVQQDIAHLSKQERTAFFESLNNAFHKPEHMKHGHLPECKIVGVADGHILEKGEKGTYSMDDHGHQVWHKFNNEKHEVHNEKWGGKQFHVQADGPNAIYDVKQGDTLFSVAKAYLSRDGKAHTQNEIMAEVKTIAEANHTKDFYTLLVGNSILIPGAGDKSNEHKKPTSAEHSHKSSKHLKTTNDGPPATPLA